MIDWLPAILKGIGDIGVANVLREKVGLLDRQLSQAIAERDTLATQLAQAKAKIEGLESDKTDLQTQLDNAREEIERLGQQQNPHASVDTRALDLLVHIANKPEGSSLDPLYKHFGYSKPKGDYFFAQLIQHKLVQELSAKDGVGTMWGATPEGKATAFRRRG